MLYCTNVGIRENDNNEVVVVESTKGADSSFTVWYDKNWLEENLDYPTILNNFIYLFNYTDLCGRCTLVSLKVYLTIIEQTMFTVGRQHYRKGMDYDFKNNLAQLQMMSYYRFLLNHGIRIEEVFQWFFHTYLPNEFNALGFMFNIPSKDTLPFEKCRTIAEEMDGVLKQFRMYVQEGEIDQELYLMSSEHMKVDAVPSIISEKYAYSGKNSIQNEMYLLFSDQAMLRHNRKTPEAPSSFCSLIQNNDLLFSDFYESHHHELRFLEEQGSIVIAEDGSISLNKGRISILNDLYKNEVICPNYYRKHRGIVDKMISNGELIVENTLFSRPEQDYLNFHLNKAAFSNGYDLRNKYSHSTYRRDDETQWSDYYMLLKIMIIVITKINEEFVLKAQINAKNA